jgi:hypothetical protein
MGYFWFWCKKGSVAKNPNIKQNFISAEMTIKSRLFSVFYPEIISYGTLVSSI